MKRIKNICIMLVFLFTLGITYNVKADTIKYYLSTKGLDYNYVSKENAKDVSVKRGDTILVSAILDYSDGEEAYGFDKGKLTIRWDDKYLNLIEYTKGSSLSSMQLNSVNKTSDKIVINNLSANEVIKSGKNILVEFKFQVLENSNTGSTKIYQMDGEDSINLIKTSDTSNIRVDSLYTEVKYNVSKSTENRLSSLKINGNAISDFNENTSTYSVKVDSNIEKINIEAISKDKKAIVSGNIGEVRLNYGVNKLSITVTSESGTKNTYNVNVTREDTRSSVNTLKTLTLSSGDIIFKPEVTEYTVNVENEIDEITITTSLTDPKSKYVEDYSKKLVKLDPGSNKIQIKVVSEKGEERVYTININRALSTNNSLKSLKIDGKKIDLVDNEYTYNYEVENEVDSIVITAVANDDKATVELKDKYELEVGENEINILVTAASGDKASYIINVNRKKILSKDSLLKSLTIKDYDINFKQNVTSYDLQINKDVETLDITYEVEDANAKVEIEGNKDLINGSIIKINVKAEDGTYTRHFINIEKISSRISPIIIIILILMLLLGACLGLLFFRKKKAKEKRLVKEEVNDSQEVQEETTNNEEVSVTHEEASDTKEIQEKVQEQNEETQDEQNEEESPKIERGAHEYTGEHEYTGDNEKDIE